MVKTSGVTEKLRTENANPEHEHGTGNVELGLQLSSRFRVPGSVVRKEGLEPPYPFGYQILSLARLPVPPLSRPISVSRATVRRGDGTMVRGSGPGSWCHAVFRRALGRIRSIRGRTLARLAARFTFEMMSSSTGPREDAREFMARRAGTRLILSCTLCASSVV